MRNTRIIGLWLSGVAPLLLAMSWASTHSAAPEGMTALSAGLLGWGTSLAGSVVLLTSLAGDRSLRTRGKHRSASAFLKPVAATLAGISLASMLSLPAMLMRTAGEPVLVVGMATGVGAFALLLVVPLPPRELHF